MAEFVDALAPADKKRYLEKLKLDVGETSVQLPDPYNIAPTEWLDDRSLWPDTDYGCIYNYLIKTPGPYDGEAMQAYKSLDAYNYFASGHVRECRYHPIKDELNVCYLKAKVIPGQRVTESPHQPWLCLNKRYGYVVAAHCTCMAGLGEVCSHIAALLFTVEAAASLLENQIACTSKRAAWNLYYKQKVETSEVEDLDLSHPRYGADKPKRMRRNRPRNIPPLDDTEAAEAFNTIKSLCPTAGICIKSPSDTDSASEDEDRQDYPPVVYRLVSPYSKYDAEVVLRDATVTSSQILNLSRDTKGQANSALWHQYRKGRITSTSMHDVVHTRTPTSVVRKIMQYDTTDLNKIPAVEWGRKHESKAREEYHQRMLKDCQNVYIEETGFVVYSRLSFIGASPDGLKRCSCHEGIKVLEIKCPFKYRESLPDCSVALEDPGYCLDKNRQLKRTHRYFTQVQTHMLVTGANACDFVVWTPKGFIIVSVPKDKEFQEMIVSKSREFLRDFLIPELSSRQLEDADITQEEDQNLYCSCQRPPFGRMIKCDGKNCAYQWFHYDCVGIKRNPKGTWFCQNCISE